MSLNSSGFFMLKIEKKEENIEAEILCFFLETWVLARKNDIKGFFNQNKWFYQKNKSNFIRNGISDITALYQWKYIAIEVKKPSEMNFFDRDIETLRQEYAKAIYRVKDPKRYLHAVEQREFLDDIIKNWWIWFFACSIKEVRERLEKNWVIL